MPRSAAALAPVGFPKTETDLLKGPKFWPAIAKALESFPGLFFVGLPGEQPGRGEPQGAARNPARRRVDLPHSVGNGRSSSQACEIDYQSWQGGNQTAHVFYFKPQVKMIKIFPARRLGEFQIPELICSRVRNFGMEFQRPGKVFGP